MNPYLTQAELLTDSATDDALDGIYFQLEDDIEFLANSEHMFDCR